MGVVVRQEGLRSGGHQMRRCRPARLFNGRAAAVKELPRNWRHNTVNTNELYESSFNLVRLSAERQFLAQVTNPQVFVIAI
jgi:hypothetical protein